MPTPKFEPYDYVYALEMAAEFLELEEWPDPADSDRQEAAYKAAAVAIRKMADRYAKKYI